jgi:HEAT repeat protein
MRAVIKVRRIVIFILAAYAGAAWAQIGPPEPGWGADRLAAHLTSDDTAVAVDAAKALAELKYNAVAFNALAGAVENKKLDAPVRLASIRALEGYGEPRAATSFIAVLGHDDVRWAAADALLSFKSADVTSRLVRVLSSDKKAKRRATAAYALGRFRDAAAFQPLLAALRDRDADVRARACAAAAAYGDRAAVEPLIANLRTDKKSRGRLAAAQALGVVRDERSVRPLAEALNDKKAEVRAAAAVSLAAVGDARAMDPLRARLKKEKDKAARAAMTQALDDFKTAILSEVKP